MRSHIIILSLCKSMNHNQIQKLKQAGTQSLSSLYPCNFQGKFHHGKSLIPLEGRNEENSRAFKRRHTHPGGSVVKNLPANAGDAGLIPGSGRSSGEGNGYLLQYSCLENPMDRGAWWVTVHGVAEESDTN